MKTILFANTLFPPRVVGGAELSVAQLAKFASNEYQTYVLSTSDGKRSERYHDGTSEIILIPENDPPSKRHPLSKISKAFYYFKENYNFDRDRYLLKIINEIQPDIVHTNNLARIGTSIWKYSSWLGIPVIHTVRDRRLLCLFHMYKTGSLCERQCTICRIHNYRNYVYSQRVKNVVFISRDIKRSFDEAQYFKSANAYVISNGVKQVVRENFQPSTPYTFGFLGSLTPAKGIDILLNSFIQAKLGSNLLVGGTGDAHYVEQLKSQYNSSNVSFLGRVDPQDFFQSIDILVVPSRFREPFGRVVIEAFSAGVPVLASNHGSFPEIIRTEETGWLFDNTQERCNLVDQLRHLATLPITSLMRMSKMCLFEYNCKYTENIMATNYLNHYKRILNLDRRCL